MDDTVGAVRGFNRYYTRVIGALGEGHLDSPYTLTEARILYELAQHESVDVAELRRGLALDAGYVTRILTRFDADHLITRRRSASDARRQVVALTKQGRAAFGKLNRRASSDVSRLLSPLSDGQRARLRGAMDTIRTVLEPEARAGNVTVRAPEAGDLGWIVQRNGELYAAEYGWDATFEALVATIVGDFAAHHDPAHERAWIADVDGQRAGCIMCVRADGSADVAKLRLLLTDPPTSRSCGCCSSSRPHAGSASGAGWSPNASTSRAARATPVSSCGRRASWPRRATSTSRQASSSSTRRRTTASARTSSRRPGRSSCDDQAVATCAVVQSSAR